MRQDDLWDKNYDEFLNYIETRKHRPSKYKDDERRMINWLKYNKKMMTANKLPTERVERFNHLLQRLKHYQRLNQYTYLQSRETDLFGE